MLYGVVVSLGLLDGPVVTKLPRITEREWQRQLTDLAELHGWAWVHFRPAETSRGWRTPVSGPLGKGWPDLELKRERTIYVECKREGERPTPDQEHVIALLEAAGDEVYVWRPDDLPFAAMVLRRRDRPLIREVAKGRVGSSRGPAARTRPGP